MESDDPLSRWPTDPDTVYSLSDTMIGGQLTVAGRFVRGALVYCRHDAMLAYSWFDFNAICDTPISRSHKTVRIHRRRQLTATDIDTVVR